MTNEELVALIQHDIDSADNMERLYQQNYGLISKIARRYAYNNDIEDLMQESFFGLLEATKHYEDTAGVLFMSYASFWIKQAIIRYLENNGRSIRLPTGMLSKIMQYKKLITACQMQLGRKPTDQELCYYLGIKSEGLQAIKKAFQSEDIQSLDEFIPGADDILMGESVPDPNC